jgi:hypothetical protein
VCVVPCCCSTALARTGGARDGCIRQGENAGLRQAFDASEAVSVARGQVKGGPVGGEGARRTCARQVFDEGSASLARSIPASRTKTKPRGRLHKH